MVKITALTADASPTSDDLIVTVNDPAGTPVNRKVTLANLEKLLRSLTPQFVQTATVTWASSAAENSFVGAGNGSMVLAAGELNVVGKSIEIEAWGHLSDTGTPTLTMKAKVGSTVLATTGALTLATITSMAWRMKVIITTRAIGVTGNVFVQGQFWYDDNGVNGRTKGMVNTAVSAALDLTGALTLDVTQQWGTSSPSNTQSCTHLMVKRIN